MEKAEATPDARRERRKKIGIRLLFLGAAGAVLYILGPNLVDFFSQTKELSGIHWYWFAIMAVFMSGSFLAAWELTHIAVPDISRFVAATSQLVSNATAKVVPGGPVAAGATYFQMLSVSGVPTAQAATALTAVSFISNLVLFSLPAIALTLAAVSAPVPSGLVPVGVAGAVMFVLMFAAVATMVKYDRVLLAIGNALERLITWLAKKLKRDWTFTAENLLEQRNDVVAALGKRWQKALAAAVLNWGLDYMVLLVALIAIGANPRPSLVLVAFAGAAVLGMIPITPGGLGFVELGLTALLVASGIGGPDAALATLTYRVFQFWLPIPAGAVAYVFFKRQFGKPAELAET